MKPKVFAVDFDQTIALTEYPTIIQEIPHCFHTLHKIQDKGHKIILLTMRHGEPLTEAVEFITNRGIKLYGINNNPQQYKWTQSPKVFANHYIDDASIGCPLTQIQSTHIVDWFEIDKLISKLI